MAASTYFTSLLNQTTSKYNDIKKALISGDADGDTEDDSHISRVLRAYYTEKGRPFPEWLPPDPKAPPPPMPSQYASSSTQSLTSQSSGRWGRSGGLSDLWDGPKQQQQEPQGAPQSLRPRFNASGPMDNGPAAPIGGRSGRFGDLYDSTPGGRTTPGSRYPAQDPSPSPAPSIGSGSTTTKDMLKAKLWGGRTGSPTPSTGSGGYAPPPRQGSPAFNSGGANPYAKESSGSSGGGGGGRFGGYGSQSPYGDDRGAYGSDRNSQPTLSSNSSWSGGDNSQGSVGESRGYGGGPYSQSGQRQTQGQRVGLPSGPRPRRI